MKAATILFLFFQLSHLCLGEELKPFPINEKHPHKVIAEMKGNYMVIFNALPFCSKFESFFPKHYNVFIQEEDIRMVKSFLKEHFLKKDTLFIENDIPDSVLTLFKQSFSGYLKKVFDKKDFSVFKPSDKTYCKTMYVRERKEFSDNVYGLKLSQEYQAVNYITEYLADDKETVLFKVSSIKTEKR